MADWTLGGDARRPTPSNSASLTAAQLVHERLRDEIVSLQRRPGDVIYEKEIAQEAQVSRTPVREALLRLADEKLVEIVPKSGTIVARIPVAKLPEIILARTALETITVRAAAERARGSDVAGLRALIELQREKLEAGDQAGFHAADETMHRAIAEAAGLPGIWEMVQQIKVQLDRYRRLTLPQPHRMELALDEHAALVDAIAAHDADTAAARVAAHLEGLNASLATIRELNPDYFAGDVDAVYERWAAQAA
ncbi:GntR family transcriptional regulator [Rubrivivax gelatinosus]|uniref:GntR family transcriptional regulator n=1 Tax=Rubrivivax gelatinosus TaxID=28068 RepID=A0A4R2MKD9_RUBGE|nr:GntR family transcriptional regulator [Rubrivivax gelatinosus]MBK1690331.1 GntR family transcriptional regulator [Rubrivivax gelatinosus]TCP05487.1 GntR family transcriptional regulator [Rubrivivax gelatinosus]